MARYVTLIRFTEAGARASKNSPGRARAFAKQAAKRGVTVETQLWTVGSCDGILIVRADDEQAALRVIAKISPAGFVRTETLQAFDADEFLAITR
jgi:uncharacterized protein with GYD domain